MIKQFKGVPSFKFYFMTPSKWLFADWTVFKVTLWFMGQMVTLNRCSKLADLTAVRDGNFEQPITRKWLGVT